MFFKKESKEESIKNNWKNLVDISQLEENNQLSFTHKILIFKHSTRCSISIMALRIFEKNFNFANQDYQAYFLDLLNHRDISNAIAEKYNVTHQSPQVLVIENGKCTQHASHEDISEMKF